MSGCTAVRSFGFAATLALASCTGSISPADGPVTGGGSGGTGMMMPKPPIGNEKTAGPTTGQRLTDRQYLNVLSDLFGLNLSDDAAGFPLDAKVEGFRNAAAALLPSDLRIEGYDSLASIVAAKVDWAALLARDGVCADFTDACQGSFFSVMGKRLFRRPLDDAQKQRFVPIFQAVKKEGDTFPIAVSLVMRAMLQSPEFLYRLEPSAGTVDDFALATRLSFLLWNSAPDDALLDAAGRSQLSAATTRQSQIQRMLADQRARRALRDYVDDWLDADKLLRTSRDSDRFPRWTGTLAADMREEIHRLFERTVWQEDADLLNIFRADRTMVTTELAQLYGLAPPPSGMKLVEQTLSPSRQGLLTQAGILTVTSVGGPGSSIVDRGAFISRNLLCQPIPSPPSNVPELPPAGAGRSERDRLAEHRANPTCGACHNQIDPLGLAFETFDAIGAFQAMDEAGNKLTGAGTLNLDGKAVPYASVREFVAALTRSPELGGCMVRKVVQYAFARPLETGDEGILRELGMRFEQGGRRYKGLLTALAEGALSASGGVSQ